MTRFKVSSKFLRDVLNSLTLRRVCGMGSLSSSALRSLVRLSHSTFRQLYRVGGEVRGGEVSMGGLVVGTNRPFGWEDIALDDVVSYRVTDPYVVGSSVVFRAGRLEGVDSGA